MKITPLEIRQKEFDKKLRGYDKDDVNAFLQSLSREWERLNDESKGLKKKLDIAEQDVYKHREVESSLYKALKTAEDTSATIIDQANKSAELHLKEAQMNAEVVLSDARQQAKSMIEDAEAVVRNILDSMKNQVKDLEDQFRKIENQRDNLLRELKNMANDMLERIDRINDKRIQFQIPKSSDMNIQQIDLNDYELKKPRVKVIEQGQKEMQESIVSEAYQRDETKHELTTHSNDYSLKTKIIKRDQYEGTEDEANDDGSFFDQI